MPDLLTIADIAAMLRAHVRTVRDRWVHRPDFPKPHFAPSHRHRMWRREDVVRWEARGKSKAA